MNILCPEKSFVRGNSEFAGRARVMLGRLAPPIGIVELGRAVWESEK